MITNIANNENAVRLKRLLGKFGLNVRLQKNVKPLDLRESKYNSYIEAIYESGKRGVIVSVPLCKCIFSLNLAFPCTPNSVSPQIQTLLDYAQGIVKCYSQSKLEYFYDHFTPRTAAQLMGLARPSYEPLQTLPAAAALLPWWGAYSPTITAEARSAMNISEARQHHVRRGKVRGDQFFGPVSDAKGKLEFKRLTDVYRSISRNGLLTRRSGFGNIEASILVGGHVEQDERFFIIDGTHRVAAAVALGFETIDIQVNAGSSALIRRADSAYWPAVRHGYISPAEAVLMFDRIANGEQPAAFIQSCAGQAD